MVYYKVVAFSYVLKKFYLTNKSSCTVTNLIKLYLCVSITLTRLIFARLIFAWTYYRKCQNQNFSLGFIFAHAQISVISRGLIFAVDIICFFLNVFKQKEKIKRSWHENSIFPQCIYSKYYACNFTKSLLLLTIQYHYCHHLNVQ